MKQKIKEEQSIDILKRVAKRVEEATIDISDMKSDLKMVSIRLSRVEHNTEIMKVDIETMKVDLGETRNELGEVEERLGKRITHVADLITISLGKKLQHIQQAT